MGRGRPSSSEDFLLSAGDRSRADGVLCDWVLAEAQSGPSVLAGAPSYLYFTPRIHPELLAEDPQSATATGALLASGHGSLRWLLFSDRPSAKATLGVRLVFARSACISLPVDSEYLSLSGS